MAPKILMILSSATRMGDKEIGWFLPEFAHPYTKFEGKADITVASVKGGFVQVDPKSVELTKDDAESQDFLKTKEHLWKDTAKLSTFVGKAGEFDAIFYVGGHGPMYDLATDTDSQQLIKEFWEAGKIVSAVCHGPAALANAKLSDGSYLISGKSVTGFSNDEEDNFGTTQYMPFMLEDQLKINGGKFSKAEEMYGPYVVTDGKLMTGQNPASASPLGEAVVAALGV